MRARCVIRRVVLCYALICMIPAIFLGELAFRVPITQRQKAEATAAQFGAVLQDVSVAGSDGSHLKGWFARPANANDDAVILLHGIGDNRQGMMGFAELFLANGLGVLVPDSRAHGESGGDFPTYGIKETDDIGRSPDSLQEGSVIEDRATPIPRPEAMRCISHRCFRRTRRLSTARMLAPCPCSMELAGRPTRR
jgi:hypothetical protein